MQKLFWGNWLNIWGKTEIEFKCTEELVVENQNVKIRDN